MADKDVAAPIELYQETYGQGDPLICLHGFGGSLYSWRNFIEPLSKNYQLTLIDLKGFGKSPKPKDKRYSPFDHAELVRQFILEHDLKELALIGNSFGGVLALLLAIIFKESGVGSRLRSMILIDPGAYADYVPFYLKLLSVPLLNSGTYLVPARAAVRAILRKAYYDPSKITEEQIEAYAQPLSGPGGRYASLETARQLVPPNFDELVVKYKTIDTPTLIIWGRQDKVLPLESGERLHGDLHNSTLKVIEQCGHMPQEEKPEETIPLVLDFLAFH